MSDKRKIIMDCDPGTDDSVCIVMALTHPDVELLGITTESGNLPADKTTAKIVSVASETVKKQLVVAVHNRMLYIGREDFMLRKRGCGRCR